MRRIAFVVLAFVLSTANGAYAASFDSLISFGDSLSDTGSGPATPPSFGGRFSNGPVWEEYLAGDLGIAASSTQDFAIGGATSGTLGLGGVQTGLLTQVAGFVAAPVHLGSDTLFTVWAGGNDAINAVLTGGDPVVSATQAAANIAMAVSQLAGAGAQNFLVPNLPNGGLFPITQSFGIDPAQANQLTLFFNGQLDADLAPLAATLGIHLFRLDTYSLYQNIVANPGAFDLTNLVDPCRTGSGASQTTCANPDQYLFWDDVHPTTHVHSIIAGAALAALPEPTVLVLVFVATLLLVSSRFAGTAASRRSSPFARVSPSSPQLRPG
jgi:phospholipase/lecithinase/hemolysin